MRRSKAESSPKKTSAKVAVLVLASALGIALLVSGGTFAKWTAALSQMTGATIQIGDWVLEEPPAISTDVSLPDASVGVEYRFQFEAANSENAVWSRGSILPSGLTLSSDGVLSGIPTFANTSNFSIRVKTSAGSDERSFNLVVHPAAPVFDESQMLPDAFDGKRYDAITLKASGISKVYELTSGELPNGLILSSFGTISGTPVGYGIFTFTVTVSNSSGSDIKEFTINLNSDFPYITTSSLPDATKDAHYSQYLQGSGPSPTYAIVSGSLPSGIALDTNTGRLVGTPKVHGLSNFTVSKTNSMGTATQDLSIYVRYAAPTITTSSLPTVRKNVPYSQQLAGIGEESTFAIAEGRLPAGLSLDPVTGLISGATEELGDFSVTITRTNESGVATRTYEFRSLLRVPVITTEYRMPDGYLDNHYEMQNTVVGEEIVWTVSDLPAGFSIDPVSGLISGTPTVVTTVIVKVTATNSGGSSTANLLFATRNAFPEIVTTSMADGEVGVPYSQPFVVTGLNITYRLSSSSSTLPPGLSFNTSTGVLAGTPTKSGTYTATFSASNNGGRVNQVIPIVIKADFPTITTDSLEPAIHGTSYSLILGGNGDASTYTVTAGVLPSGMTLNSSTGRITGTPSTSAHGLYNLTITKKNPAGEVSKDYVLRVVYQTPTITTNSISQGRLNTNYSSQLAGVGNGATYTIIEGALPGGLTISDSGLISGAPTSTGEFSFTVQKTNESGSASKSYLLSVVHVSPRMVTTSFPNATIGVPYFFQIGAIGEELVYSSSSVLPDGLTLNPNTGIISGTPTATGSFYQRIVATNSGGTATLAASLYSDHVIPVVVTTEIPSGMIGETYYAKIETIGEEVRYTASGLPSSLKLDTETGIISGTPTSENNNYVTIMARNSGGLASVRIPLVIITQPPTITTETLPDGVIGTRIQQLLTGVGSSNTYSITAGQLPPGINMGTSNGNVNGTPTTRGTYTFTVTKTNISGTVSKEFTMKISQILPTLPAVTSLRDGAIGQSYNVTVGGVGTDPTYEISEGILPPGLSIDPKSGRITGTPTTAGNYSFTIRKWNLDGEISQEFSINVPGVAGTASLAEAPVSALFMFRSGRGL